MNKFDVSWASLWKIFFMLILAVGLFLVREVIVILFLAIIISSAIDPLVSFLERKKIPRIFGTLLIFIVAFAALGFLLYAIIPVTVVELKNFLSNLDNLKLPFFGQLEITRLTEQFKSVFEDFGSVFIKGGVSFLTAASAIFSNIIFILAAFILSFYLSVNQAGVEKFLRAILPAIHEDYVIAVYLRVRRKLGLWLQGQLILMFFVGCASFLGLWIIGVKYSLILGILAGFLEIVPVVGPIFAGVLAFLIAVPESLTLGIYVILLFVAIQQLESHLVVPLVMSRAVGINPVVVVISLMAGAQIAGFVGIILAVPSAVILQEIIEDRDKRKPRSLVSQ